MNTTNEVLRLTSEELDRLAEALDYLAESHPHAGGRYLLIYLSDQAATLADQIRQLCAEPETESP
jgi:hypothetical protein